MRLPDPVAPSRGLVRAFAIAAAVPAAAVAAAVARGGGTRRAAVGLWTAAGVVGTAIVRPEAVRPAYRAWDRAAAIVSDRSSRYLSWVAHATSRPAAVAMPGGWQPVVTSPVDDPARRHDPIGAVARHRRAAGAPGSWWLERSLRLVAAVHDGEPAPAHDVPTDTYTLY